MTKKKKLIIGNFKMNPITLREAKKIFLDIKRTANKLKNVQTVICPPFVYLTELQKVVNGDRCLLGAQNVFSEIKGSQTGEISSAMLSDLGIKYVILGHSERRAIGETSREIGSKIKLCLKYNLIPIICIGENKRDESMEYLNFIKKQLQESLEGLSSAMIKKIVIVYEPVWAIGKDAERDATPEEVQEINIFIRKILSDAFGHKVIMELTILYGGSVSPTNACNFLEREIIDGFLIGRASLQPEKFNEILLMTQEI